MSREMRQMIRAILLEELAGKEIKLPAASKPKVREEVVAIRSDRDLAGFVRRLLDITNSDQARADVEAGRHVFRLDHSPSTLSPLDSPPRASGQAITFDDGLVTEKQIHNLPDDVTVVKIGDGVRVTPLAGDAMRRAGIKIERVKT